MNPQVKLITNFWDITLELFPASAPKAVENFLGLSEKGYYSGVRFHRVIRDFMIQSGDPSGTGRGGKSLWIKPFEDEIDETLSHVRWVISMANAGPATNGSQFFIVTTEDASYLDGKHTIFGRVISDMQTIDDIEWVPTDRNDCPMMEVKIEKIEIL